uniref:Uncharacterized protein n=1 Tax=Magnetospirillum gryphiswaldense TaxID=55518 RepID=A4TZ96_9PROT|nr:hypothetical protein MGR_2257 [Magnetospirillum gryphiswaldense MSR-1]
MHLGFSEGVMSSSFSIIRVTETAWAVQGALRLMGGRRH